MEDRSRLPLAREVVEIRVRGCCQFLSKGIFFAKIGKNADFRFQISGFFDYIIQ